MDIRGPVLRTRLIAVAVLLGLIAVATVDGLVVADRRADARREAAREKLIHDKDVYAARLRTVAGHVYADVLPVQHILDTLLSPRPGDVYAARDALALPTAVTALRADLRRLAAVTPPTPYRSVHARLHNALHAMWSTATAMRQRQRVKDPIMLDSYLVDTDNAALVGAEVDWRSALRDLYRPRRQKTPATPQTGSAKHPPASLPGWVFAADRDCFHAQVRTLPLLKRLDEAALDTAALRSAATLTRELVDRLNALPVPRESRDRLRREVLLRLQSLRAEANAVEASANAIDRRDVTALRLAQDRLRTTMAATAPLGRAFRHFHAAACANFVGSGKAKPERRRVEV